MPSSFQDKTGLEFHGTQVFCTNSEKKNNFVRVNYSRVEQLWKNRLYCVYTFTEVTSNVEYPSEQGTPNTYDFENINVDIQMLKGETVINDH